MNVPKNMTIEEAEAYAYATEDTPTARALGETLDAYWYMIDLGYALYEEDD